MSSIHLKAYQAVFLRKRGKKQKLVIFKAKKRRQKFTQKDVAFLVSFSISNSYTMGCPPVRVDNPRALASGLSYVQVDKHGITNYTTYISVDLAHHEIFRAKVGKGGINSIKGFLRIDIYGNSSSKVQ